MSATLGPVVSIVMPVLDATNFLPVNVDSALGHAPQEGGLVCIGGTRVSVGTAGTPTHHQHLLRLVLGVNDDLALAFL
jgi:hypothetical protein